MGIAKIDVATGEMRVIYSQPQGTNGSALTTAGDLVFFGDLTGACARSTLTAARFCGKPSSAA